MRWMDSALFNQELTPLNKISGWMMLAKEQRIQITNPHSPLKGQKLKVV